MSDPVLYGPSARGRRGPLPLLVGVTGAQASFHSGRLCDLLSKLRKRYRWTPTVLLASLATMPGRFAAGEAQKLGYRLVAVLPAPEAAFLEGLAEETRAPVEKLLRSAERVVVHGAPDDFIRERCQIHVVPGDDWPQVSFQAEASNGSRGIRYGFGALAAILLEAPQRLWRTVNERLRASITPAGSLPPSPHAFTQANAFNRDVVHLLREIPHHQSEEDLIREGELRRLPLELQTTVSALRAWYACADALAQHFQRQARWMRWVLVVLWWLAGFWGAIAYYPPEDRPVPWAGTSASTLAGCATLFSWWMWRRHLAHVGDRALAESMRVLLFWRLAGLRQERTPSDYLNWSRTELEFVPLALRNWLFLAERDETPADALPPGRQLALDWWVQGQIHYFHKAATTVRKELTFLSWVTASVFMVSLVWSVGRWFLGYPPLFSAPDDGRVLGTGYFVDRFLGSGLFALGAALATTLPFGKRQSFREKAEDMLASYREYLERFLKHARDIEASTGEARGGLLEADRSDWIKLGMQALLESGQWVEREQVPL
jgi:hypothetical protein